MARNKTISSGFGLFSANTVKSLTENRASIVNVTASEHTGSVALHTSASFRYDDPGNPLKSTQQLKLDWSKFENHTFFNSAEAKVNMTFETIINGYPFDGTSDEIYKFQDKLTGFEKHVLDSLPHYTGFMNFNNSQFIEVEDRAGILYPDLSRETTAKAVLDPGVGSFTYEMNLYVPTARGGNVAADKQVIAQKIKNNNGITLYTKPSPAKEIVVSYTGQPSDGNSISLVSADGTSKTYEFDSGGGVSGDNVSVTISGDDADATYAALKIAIKSASGHNGKITTTHTDDNNNAGSITFKRTTKDTNDVSILGAATIGNATIPATGLTTHSDIILLATSGSVSASSKVKVKRGKWNHISACLNRNPGTNRIEMFVGGKNISRSSQFEIFDFAFADAGLTIGKGTNITAAGDITAVTFNTCLSASMDDFRIIHSARSESALDHEKNRKIEPRKNLRLNFTFNEPTGSYNNQAVILDHSGNSLHSKLSRTGSDSYDPNCRVDPGYGNPMVHEDASRYPVLFPSHPDLVTYNTRLMVSASNYDTNNPNMITKLVPDHYLREAHFAEGFSDKKELGDVEDLYGYDTDFPGGGKMGSPQIIASLLFIWAKQFDEMKLFLDQFGRVLHADYKEEDTVADTFLPFMAQYYGFELPDMFPNASLSQFAGKEGQGTSQAMSNLSLQQIQNSIWRRVLADIREIMRSKGTIHGIKTFLRNLGIDPDRSFRFREYGGSRTGRIGTARQEIKEIGRILSFTGSLASGAKNTETTTLPILVKSRRPGAKTVYTRPTKAYTDSPLIVSPFLSGTRVETGTPHTKISSDKFVLGSSSSYALGGENILRSGNHTKYGISPEASDGLFTSGSWSCEAMYMYGGTHSIKSVQPVTQSLMRMYVTGTVMSTASKEAATGTVKFTGLPTDAATITLKDSESSPTSKTFEFDTGGGITGGNVSVTIGVKDTAQIVAKNFVAAIKATTALKIKAQLLGDGRTVRLSMVTPGTPTVTKIATTGTTNTVITHFTGGFDDEILGSSFTGGGVANITGRTMLTNLVALSGSQDLQTTGSLVLFARPIPGRQPLVMALTGTDIFDGDRWNICYGRIRNDLSGTHISSSYFLQASKAMGDRLIISNRVEKLFDDHETSLTTEKTEIKIASPNAVDTVTLVSHDGTSKIYKFMTDGSNATGVVDSGAVTVQINGLTSDNDKTEQLKLAIENANGHGTDAAAAGSIVVPAPSSTVAALKTALNTDTFTISDAAGNSQIFTFRENTDNATVGIVGLKSDTSIEDIALSIRIAINNIPSLKITAAAPTGASSNAAHTISITQNVLGTAGNGSIASSGTSSPAMTYNAFTGGTSKKLTIVRNDNIIKVTQASNTPPVLTISADAKSANRISIQAKMSAVNMSAFNNITNINRSGSFIVVGDLNDTITGTSSKTYGLDGKDLALNTSLSTAQALMAQTTKFGGNLAQVRFWSKGLTEKEHQEHSLNYNSVGVENPAKNFGFAENVEGSFERLRLDVSMDQEVTGTEANKTIILKDFTQNMFDMEGYGFEASKQTIYPKTFKYSILSPNFDQSSQSNKVRVRSYLDPAVARRELVDVAPVYHIPKSEKIHDDLRFGIEISIAQALNEDIVNILATMDEIENSIGAPESQFDVGYVGLENIRDIYFNRLTDKINISNFFQFFRWFDNTIGDTIENLIPRKTKFTGVNYIIEPHLLERPKFTYNTSDMYLGENNRHGLKGEILLRQLVAIVRRF